MDLIHNEDGTIKNVIYKGIALTVSYNNGKIALIKGLNSKGGEVSYTITYNASGLITKIAYVFMESLDSGYTETFEYNASGNAIKVVLTNPNSPSLPANYDYTWENGNITKIHFANKASTQDVEYLQYDNKLNPLILDQDIYRILDGFEHSKNNIIKVKTITGSSPSTSYERAYEYNTDGYATKMSLVNLTGTGQNYYFTK